MGNDRANSAHTHGAQEKGNGFYLKRSSSDTAVENKQHPLSGCNTTKSQQNRFGFLRIYRKEKANGTKGLKQCQQKHIAEAIKERRAFGAQFCQTLLLLMGNGQKHHFYAAHINHIIGLQCADADLFPVDQNSACRIRIGDGPTPVIIAGQNTVVPGNRREINDDIAVLIAADDILPVGNGDFFPIRKHEPCPYLRFSAECKQGLTAAQQQKCYQNRRDITR